MQIMSSKSFQVYIRICSKFMMEVHHMTFKGITGLEPPELEQTFTVWYRMATEIIYPWNMVIFHRNVSVYQGVSPLCMVEYPRILELQPQVQAIEQMGYVYTRGMEKQESKGVNLHLLWFAHGSVAKNTPSVDSPNRGFQNGKDSTLAANPCDSLTYPLGWWLCHR